MNYIKTAFGHPKSTATFASGGQKPFREKVSGLPKAFHWDGIDTVFFFVPLCVPLWLKIGGGFGALIAVDLSKISGKAKRVNITIPERLLAQVDTFAKKRGETRSGLFLTAALEYISRHVAG